MKIITVSGTSSNAGKTFVVTKLLQHLKGWSGLKVTTTHKGLCPTGKNCGVCGQLRTKYSIITDKKVIIEKGKDTHRFKEAGAKRVIWLKTQPAGLKEGLNKAISKFKKTEGIIIEGNSALKYIKPDFAIFIKKNHSAVKKSAKEAIKKADLILTL